MGMRYCFPQPRTMRKEALGLRISAMLPVPSGSPRGGGLLTDEYDGPPFAGQDSPPVKGGGQVPP